jgi:hypothetical protein
MGRKRRDPHSPEAVAAVYRRIENMTKAELEHWVEKLSHASEGVYDPWSEENWPLEKELRQPSNGRAPGAEPPSAEAERIPGADGDLLAR